MVAVIFGRPSARVRPSLCAIWQARAVASLTCGSSNTACRTAVAINHDVAAEKDLWLLRLARVRLRKRDAGAEAEAGAGAGVAAGASGTHRAVSGGHKEWRAEWGML